MPNDKLTKIKASVTFDIKVKLPSDLVSSATALGGVHKQDRFTAEYEFESYFSQDQDKVEAEGNKHALALATMYRSSMEPHLRTLKGVAAEKDKKKAKDDIKNVSSKFTDATKIVKNQMEQYWKSTLKPITVARKEELEKLQKEKLGLIDKAKQALQAIKVVKTLFKCKDDVVTIKNSIVVVVQKTKAAHDRYVQIKKNPALKSELNGALQNFRLTFDKEASPIPKALKSLYEHVSKLLKALQRICEIEANVKPEALKAAGGFATALQYLKKIQSLHGHVETALKTFQTMGFGEPAIKLIIDPKGTVSDEWSKIAGIFDKMSPGTGLDQLEPIAQNLEKAEEALKTFVGSK